MLRLTLLLCLGMYAALMTLGQDRGQLRPGLAQAAAEGRLDEVWAEARARAERAAAPAPVRQAEPSPALAALAPAPAPVAPAPEPVVAASAAGEGTIWYVTARSVNVRAAPTTQSEVVGKLDSGEAALMVTAVDDDWARIVIQGDGLEGYVARRFLSPEAP